MEYQFRLAELFPEEISIVTTELVPVGCPALQALGAKVVRERVSEILDTMGRASAEAQALSSVITNADRMRNGEPDQKLYMFCDFASNKAVGLLKIGKKKLFLFDGTGTQHEMFPSCIMDFYIHESRQRQGAGKYLFEHMLRDEAIPVEHFAIDRPSDKFIYFLRRHYSLTKIMPQVNNFVVFDGFFRDRADYKGKKARWGGLDQGTPDKARAGDPRGHTTQLEDSLDYNNEPLIHLRNGGQLPPNYTQRRHNSTIGDILQPPPHQAQRNGNASNHWSHNM